MKHLTLSLTCLIVTTFLFAQEKSETTFSYEPIIGLGVSSLTFGEQEVFKENNNLNNPFPTLLNIQKEFLISFGAYAKYKLAPKSNLNAGLVFSREKFFSVLNGALFGSDYNPTTGMIISSSSIETDVKIFRLSIPIQYEILLKKSPYFFTMGISGSWILKATHESTIHLGNGTIYNSNTSSFEVRKNNFSGTLGFGRKIYFAKPNPALSVSLLANYFLKPDNLRFYNERGNNFIFSLQLGYEF